MFEYRDKRVVLILNAAGIPQGDNERDLAEQVLQEFGKLISAVLIMTPPTRRVLFHGLISELQAFSQAQSLNIVDLVKTPANGRSDQPDLKFDTKQWNERFPEWKE